MRNVVLAFLLLFACGDEADEIGVGAQCAADDECRETEPPLRCLTNFKGGYCGLTACQANIDCPEGSFCVRHTDQQSYCFRTCIDKSECNVNRDVENEANCSSNIDRVEGGNEKACVPPSSGT
jgi:hypothetical protein